MLLYHTVLNALFACTIALKTTPTFKDHYCRVNVYKHVAVYNYDVHHLHINYVPKLVQVTAGEWWANCFILSLWTVIIAITEKLYRDATPSRCTEKFIISTP